MANIEVQTRTGRAVYAGVRDANVPAGNEHHACTEVRAGPRRAFPCQVEAIKEELIAVHEAQSTLIAMHCQQSCPRLKRQAPGQPVPNLRVTQRMVSRSQSHACLWMLESPNRLGKRRDEHLGTL